MAGLPLNEGCRWLGELTRAHLLAEHVPGRFSSHDLLRAYAAELTQSADSEAERRAATGRMLDHYLHTAHSAALQLRPTGRPLALAAPQPGAEPERISDAGQALAWFEAERRVLMAATGRALEAGFDTHAWQLAWALSGFLDMRGRWHDWAVTEQIALAATQRLGDRAAQASAHQRFGYASARLGRYEDAHAHLGLALSIHDRARGPRRPGLRAQLTGHHAELSGPPRRGPRPRPAVAEVVHGRRRPARPGRTPSTRSAGSAPWSGITSRRSATASSLSTCSATSAARRGKPARLTASGMPTSRSASTPKPPPATSRHSNCIAQAGSRWGAGDTLGHLGDTCHAAGKPEEARAFWEEALAILEDLHAPEADQIRAKLRDLDVGAVSSSASEPR